MSVEKNTKNILFLSYVAVLFSACEGMALDSTSEMPLKESDNVSHQLSTEDSLLPDGHRLNFTFTTNRGIHSRTLLKNSTLGYEEWWYLTTTRRPFISARDFPGKVGVGSWKEISASKENRDGREMRPTAEAETSKGAVVPYPGLYTLLMIYLVLITVSFHLPLGQKI